MGPSTEPGRLGAIGEELAARFLERAGLAVLARNWRPAMPGVRGEIDIVARDGQTLVICEVKSRRGHGTGGPLAGVTPRKLCRLRRLAAAFLAESGLRAPEVRFDAVGVCWPAGGGPAEVVHLRGVS